MSRNQRQWVTLWVADSSSIFGCDKRSAENRRFVILGMAIALPIGMLVVVIFEALMPSGTPEQIQAGAPAVVNGRPG